MVSKKITVVNASGLHARPASVLAKEAGRCLSNVTIRVENKVVQAKSVLNIMAAGMKCGTEIELCCEGENEAEDLERLASLIESGLGE